VVLDGWGGLGRILTGELAADGVDLPGILRAVEDRAIDLALARTDGNQSQAAALLGLNRDKLRYRLRNHGKE
jgi:DNA-binding protein Fis